MNLTNQFIQPTVERMSFGVCSFLAEKWGLNESRVRAYFIYTTFAAFGSPIIVYLATAFWINFRKYLRGGQGFN